MLVNSSRPELQKLSEVAAALGAEVDTLPISQAAERLLELSGRLAVEPGEPVRGEAVLGELLVRLDPYQPGFPESLDSALPFGSPPVVERLLALFPAHLPVFALRQLWAVAANWPVMAAMLARGVLSAPVAVVYPELAVEMRRLLALATEVGTGRYVDTTEFGSGPLRHSFLAKALVSCINTRTGIPELGGWRNAKPGLRLRFALADLCREQADTAELLTAATEIPGVTQYLVEREISRAVAAAASQGAPLALLPALEAVYLPPRAQRWLQGSRKLRTLALEGAPSGYVRWSKQQQAAYSRTTRLVEGIQSAVRSANFTRAGELLLAVPAGELADRVLRTQLAAPQSPDASMDLPERRNARRWLPMAVEPAALWQARVPAVQVPAWWTASLGDVAAGLLAGRWTWASLSAVGRARLQASWKPEHEQALIAEGVYAAVSPKSNSWRQAGAAVAFQLAQQRGNAALPLLRKVLLGLEDARPLLAIVAADPGSEQLRESFARILQALQPNPSGASSRLSWFRWEAPLIGSAEWRQAPTWTRCTADRLLRMPGYLQRGGRPLDVPGYVAVFENELLNVDASTPEVARAVARLVARWRKVQPESAQALVAQLPPLVLVALLQLRKLPAGFAETVAKQLSTLGTPVPEDDIDTLRLRNPEHLEHVAAALWRRSGEQGKPITWNPTWDRLPGAPSLRDACRLLLARHSARSVMALAREFGEARFAQAARHVAAKLAAVHPREAALLELAIRLSPEEMGSLWVAVAWCRRGAPAGCLLDHTYRRYSLPKQSGGTRTIHAPAAPVKAAQRAVLRAYLAPLGAHAAACGFVAGRSIADNAAPHVGQRVVANADVRQCFPSVRWSRVLGALRRDFAAILSPAAIGLLTDLVTAEGALPTGAPTSPALLNRVLLRSDEILSQLAAARGVNYTRYADDLTFSGSAAAVKMLGHAQRVLAQVGLTLDEKKTHIFRRGRRQVVTGLVVNDRVSVPRKLRRELRAAVHAAAMGKPVHWHGAVQSLASLRGRLAFLAMAHPEEAQALRKRLPPGAAE